MTVELMFFAILASVVGLGVGIVFATRKGLAADITANDRLQAEIQQGLEQLARRRSATVLDPEEVRVAANEHSVRTGSLGQQVLEPVEALPVASAEAGSAQPRRQAPYSAAERETSAIGQQGSSSKSTANTSDQEGTEQNQMLDEEADPVPGRLFVRDVVNAADGSRGFEILEFAGDFPRHEVNRRILVRTGAETVKARSRASLAVAGEYLTFRLGAEEYGIDIQKVQEIRNYERPTGIANAPEFLKGVVNLRGVIVPIVDLRVKLGCPTAEYNSFTVVIVLNVKNRVIGAVVDSVSDVLELGRDAIRPAPELSSPTIDTSFITGIGAVADRILILMDIEGLMSSAEMGLMDLPLATA